MRKKLLGLEVVGRMSFKINLKKSVEWSFILLVDPRGGHTLTMKIDLKVGSYTN